MLNDIRNGSGCVDPTAHEAIKQLSRSEAEERRKVYRLIGGILRICELAGYEFVGTMAFKNVETGKIWPR